MLFDNNLPFKIKEKIITNNAKKTFVEINLSNNTNYNLHIVDYSMQINKNSLDSNSSFKLKDVPIDSLIKPFSEIEEFSLEPEDEYSLIYVIDNYDALQYIENFNFKLNWVNIFDSVSKQICFIIKNKLINDIINLSVYDHPVDNIIILDEIIMLKFLVKNVHKSKFILSYLKLYF
jgi:hypothetical protein